MGVIHGGSPAADGAGRLAGAAIGVAAGRPPAADVTAGANRGTVTVGDHPIDIALALVAAQRVRGHFVPRHCTDAELRMEDPRLQRLTDADRRLCGVYGDTIHQNDGTHLDGEIGVARMPSGSGCTFGLRLASSCSTTFRMADGLLGSLRP